MVTKLNADRATYTTKRIDVFDHVPNVDRDDDRLNFDNSNVDNNWNNNGVRRLVKDVMKNKRNTVFRLFYFLCSFLIWQCNNQSYCLVYFLDLDRALYANSLFLSDVVYIFVRYAGSGLIWLG